MKYSIKMRLWGAGIADEQSGVKWASCVDHCLAATGLN